MLPGALTAKLGPLPAWAWGLLVGVGVLGYAYLHRSSASADSTSADATAGDTTGTASDTTDLSSLDSSAPLDFAGPTSGYANATPNVPQSLRIDPAQWARLQKELKQLRQQERRDHQRNPKHKKHKGQPTQPHAAMRQPSRQRPRATGPTVNSGSGGR